MRQVNTKEHNRLLTALNEAMDEVERLHGIFINDLANIAAPVFDAMQVYTDALAAAREFTEEQHGDAECYYDDRSERWQEGERGEAFRSWIDEDLEIDWTEPEWTAHLDDQEDPVTDHEAFEMLVLEPEQP